MPRSPGWHLFHVRRIGPCFRGFGVHREAWGLQVRMRNRPPILGCGPCTVEHWAGSQARGSQSPSSRVLSPAAASSHALLWSSFPTAPSSVSSPVKGRRFEAGWLARGAQPVLALVYPNRTKPSFLFVLSFTEVTVVVITEDSRALCSAF